MMAVSGGATTAYVCQVHDWRLVCQPTTRLRSECATVDHALQVLAAGSDMAVLRMRLQQAGVQ